MTLSGEYVAFVSYASENREKAEEICANLERRGLPCWIAPRNVRAGHEYADEILLGIERSAALVLVLSEAANTSPFVSREVERAVAKEKPLFPVRIEEVMPASGLELLVSADHWTDVWTGRWDGHMDRLARDLSDRVRGTHESRTSSRRRALAGARSFGVFGGMAALLAGSPGLNRRPQDPAAGICDRSDIFALGAIIYEMVTGHRAFEGTTAATLIGAILHVDPPAISSRQKWVSLLGGDPFQTNPTDVEGACQLPTSCGPMPRRSLRRMPRRMRRSIQECHHCRVLELF